MCRFLHISHATAVPPTLGRADAAEGASMKRTQILLPDDLHRKLLKHAKTRKTSMGDLIRQAVERAYFARLEDLALVAYRNGLISLGKLAEVSGTNPARALELLREKGIAPLFGPESADEARQDAAVAARAR
jgi:predicted HTH domain antitoxin